MGSLTDFGELLRRHRKAMGLTQAELAAEAGVSVRSLGEYERGRGRRVHRSTISRLADALGLTGEARIAFEGAGRAPRPEDASSATSRASLMIPSTTFIGRTHEIATARSLLLRDGIQLLTLTGAGGCGKTRLAVAVAEALTSSFVDGIHFVSLGALTDPGLVPASIAQALSLHEEGPEPISSLVIGFLSDKQALLLLDSFEHVLQAAPFIHDLLSRCHGLKVLVTSRVVLRLAAEYELPVPPLEVPRVQKPGALQALLDYDAVALFVERARMARPWFALTESNAQAVVEICRRLDGLPLALELAAARTRVFPLEALQKQLSDPLDLLKGGPSDAPPRHRTLRNAIDWSFHLLTRADQRLFVRLAVFASDYTLEAVRRVCGGRDSQPIDGLIALVESSLLQPGATVADEPRFMMLETIRDYATEKLRQSGQERRMQERHARYFAELAEQAEEGLRGESQAIWLSRLEASHDDLRRALHWSSQQDTATALRLGSALCLFWYIRGHLMEGRRWTEALLACVGPQVAAADRRLYAKLLNGAGVLAWQQGDYKQARAWFEEALHIRRALGDDLAISATATNLGNVAARQGEYSYARQLFEESLAIGHRLGDTWEVATALNNLSNVAYAQEDYETGRTLAVESLGLLREIGDRWNTAIALNTLGNLETLCGEYELAQRHLEEGLELFRDLRDPWGTGGTLANLGALAIARQEYRIAARHIKESLRLSREVGEQSNVAESLVSLAVISAHFEDYRSAMRLIGAAEALWERMRAVPDAPTRREIDRVVGQTRAHAGEEVSRRLREDGREMIPDEAVEVAFAALSSYV